MSNKTTNNDPKSSPSARGKRLKTARMMAELTRNGLEAKYGVSASTIQSWEAAKAGGLTERGAQRIVPILEQEGIFCSTDWLLYGIGAPPQPKANDVNTTSPSAASSPYPVAAPEDKAIIQELLHFRDLHPNAIDYIIRDDGMKPYFAPNDLIAGKRRRGPDISRLVGMDCIIETINNEVLFRRIKPGTRNGLYTLICTNPDTTVSTSTLYDQELISAAPVIWHRRRDRDSREKK